MMRPPVRTCLRPIRRSQRARGRRPETGQSLLEFSLLLVFTLIPVPYWSFFTNGLRVDASNPRELKK